VYQLTGLKRDLFKAGRLFLTVNAEHKKRSHEGGEHVTFEEELKKTHYLLYTVAQKSLLQCKSNVKVREWLCMGLHYILSK